MEDENYTPFGPEWEKELMKWRKDQIEETFGISAKGVTKREQIQMLRERLKSETR